MKNFGNRQIIGKCSICGGIVSVPKVYMSVRPMKPNPSGLKKYSWNKKEYRWGLEGTI